VVVPAATSLIVGLRHVHGWVMLHVQDESTSDSLLFRAAMWVYQQFLNAFIVAMMTEGAFSSALQKQYLFFGVYVQPCFHFTV
jgi:hypothetical protein